MSNVSEILEKITDLLKTQVKTDTLIGQPFQLGEYTCVPVISVGVGFGAGAMKSQKNASLEPNGSIGGAAGIGMKTIGFLVSRGDTISFVPTETSRGVNAVIEKIPDILQRFIDKPKGNASAVVETDK